MKKFLILFTLLVQSINAETVIETYQVKSPQRQIELDKQLLYSVKFQSPDFVLNFLHAGANPNSSDIRLNTPLHHAVDLKNHNATDIVKFLLKYGAKPNITNEFGSTPLHEASSFNKVISIHKALLEHGADINKKDQSGNTSLHLVVQNPNLDILRLFLKYEANLDIKNKNGWTALDIAKKASKYDSVNILREFACKATFK